MADTRIKNIMAESMRERTMLVQSALRSLEELRTHQLQTESGVRVKEALGPEGRPGAKGEDEAMAFLQIHHDRWGAGGRNTQEMVVRYNTWLPLAPPCTLHPTARPSLHPAPCTLC